MTRNIEVVDFEPHSDDPMQVIKKKCQRAYPDYFTLLVLARNGNIIKPEKFAEEIGLLKVPFSEV
jgi:hypothetical protein